MCLFGTFVLKFSSAKVCQCSTAVMSDERNVKQCILNITLSFYWNKCPSICVTQKHRSGQCLLTTMPIQCIKYCKLCFICGILNSRFQYQIHVCTDLWHFIEKAVALPYFMRKMHVTDTFTAFLTCSLRENSPQVYKTLANKRWFTLRL